MLSTLPSRASAIAMLFLLSAGAVASGARAQVPMDPLEQAYDAGIRAFHGNDLGQAAAHFERALALARERYGPADPRLATDLNNLAEVYRLLGRYPEAERLYLEALALDRQKAGANATEIATTLNNLALLYRAQGRLREAEELYREASTLIEKSVGPKHLDMARLLNNWAMLKLAAGEPQAALELEQRALAVARATLPADHPSLRVLEANLERIRSAVASRNPRAVSNAEVGESQGETALTAQPTAGQAQQSGLAPLARGFAVHLASLSSQEAALSAAAKLRARHEFLRNLAILPPQPVEIAGKGTLWRVLFGPLASRREAMDLCARAKTAKLECFVRELGG